MKEDESNWFSKWEDELPLPEDLMPISQTLITPHLAIAFDIKPPNPHTPIPPHNHQINQEQVPISTSTSEFDSPELLTAAAGSGGGGDEPARTLKRPRLVWTPQLHKRFVDAVAHLGIKNAVPKTIMQLMSVDGLTRENVASHLQKYRLYLKRMQGISSGGGGGGTDPATDHLFASSPVPAHFLHRGNSDQFLPYVPVAGGLQHHHHQMTAATAAAVLQPRYGQIGQFSSARNGQFDNSFMNRRIGNQIHGSVGLNYAVDDLESVNGRKVLTLFPTGDD